MADILCGGTRRKVSSLKDRGTGGSANRELVGCRAGLTASKGLTLGRSLALVGCLMLGRSRAAVERGEETVVLELAGGGGGDGGRRGALLPRCLGDAGGADARGKGVVTRGSGLDVVEVVLPLVGGDACGRTGLLGG